MDSGVMPFSPSLASCIPGQVRALRSDSRGSNRVPELGSLGSVRWAFRYERPYREPAAAIKSLITGFPKNPIHIGGAC
jgi:hypothetical protein